MAVPLSICRGDYTGMEFGKNLKRLRAAKKLKQDELAELVGVAQPTIQRWEGGKRAPRRVYLDKLAAALAIPVADLYQEEEVDVIPSADELAEMIERAMKELPVGVSYEDYPSAVSANLHAQLERYRAAGGFRQNEGEATSPDKDAQFRTPTNSNAPGGSRNQ